MSSPDSAVADPQDMIEAVRLWAVDREDIHGLLLVGSHARGEARPDSDIDFVLLCESPAQYLDLKHWVAEFGFVESVKREDWGRVQSLRVHYRGAPEVEFGITDMDCWLEQPLDPGTVAVLRSGYRIVLDPVGELASRLDSV